MDLDRRTLLRSGALAVPLLSGPALLDGPAEAAPAVGKVLARDLLVPWGLAFLPNGNALVGERPTGRVHVVRRTGGRRLVGQVRGLGGDLGEGGLLGLAVSPTFRRDRWVYAYYSTGSDNRIVRMRYVDGRLRKQHLVLAGIPVSSTHNGGRLLFARNGLLLAGTGDAGDPSLAQNRRSLGGKILRMTPSGGVPSGNPFGNHVWSYGHRNVQGLALDRRRRLWATELGQSERDELNRIRKGGNYGWPVVEGGDGSGPFRDPFVTWSPAECSPSGVAVARGRAWVGALRGRALWSVRLDGPNAGRKVRHFHHRFGRIRTVQKAPDGSLWITTSNRDGRGTPADSDDRVIRIRL